MVQRFYSPIVEMNLKPENSWDSNAKNRGFSHFMGTQTYLVFGSLQNDRSQQDILVDYGFLSVNNIDQTMK